MTGAPRGYPKTSSLGRMQGPSISADRTKRYGWGKHGILVVDQNDSRLTNHERQIINRLGNKLYGPRFQEA
ncbi:hypothetical protein ACQZV8_11670 [Magnetococcales bacterium HHB-1]